MPQSEPFRILVNLPTGFFRTPQLEPVWQKLEEMGTLRKTSHDTPEQIRADLIWAQAVIMWAWPTLDKELLSAAKDLKFAGHINLGQSMAKAELDHGLAVSELRHGWSPAVAEMALTLLLAGLRKTSAYHLAMKQGAEAWVEDIPADVDASERQLAGRKVGIAGFGGIGQRLAQLLEPFGVELLVHDPFIPQEILDKYNARAVDMPALARQSEAVVLCAANTSQSRHLLGKEEIEAMDADAVLVNVGRSSLVDMEALRQRLARGQLTAMLDVFDSEPLPADDELRKLPNAFLTPHRAGGIMESVQRILTALVEELDRFRTGRDLQYAVTREMFPSLPD
jgi:phosphoglycerate dehydrogenase-like enzyme